MRIRTPLAALAVLTTTLLSVAAALPCVAATHAASGSAPSIDTTVPNPAAGIGASGPLGGTTVSGATTVQTPSAQVQGQIITTHAVTVTTNPSTDKSTVTTAPPAKSAPATQPTFDEHPNKGTPHTTPITSEGPLPPWTIPAAIILLIIVLFFKSGAAKTVIQFAR